MFVFNPVDIWKGSNLTALSLLKMKYLKLVHLLLVHVLPFSVIVCLFKCVHLSVCTFQSTPLCENNRIFKHMHPLPGQVDLVMFVPVCHFYVILSCN